MIAVYAFWIIKPKSEKRTCTSDFAFASCPTELNCFFLILRNYRFDIDEFEEFKEFQIFGALHEKNENQRISYAVELQFK